jgi:yecA family protein
MNDTTRPLSGHEMLELYAMLGPGSEETYSLTELDGFFHGILCLPRLVMPSEWLNDVLPEVASEKAMRRAVDLILRHYNAVADALRESEVEPYFDGSGRQAKQWLEGFGRAFSYDLGAIQKLADAEVEEFGDEENVPVAAFVMSFALDLENAPPAEDPEDVLGMKRAILKTLEEQPASENRMMLYDLALGVHEMLGGAREEERNKVSRLSSSSSTVTHNKKVGRNDPCPCGSGKKYKHCHGK